MDQRIGLNLVKGGQKVQTLTEENTADVYRCVIRVVHTITSTMEDVCTVCIYVCMWRWGVFVCGVCVCVCKCVFYGLCEGVCV